jgi:hypothetical protein
VVVDTLGIVYNGVERGHYRKSSSMLLKIEIEIECILTARNSAPVEKGRIISLPGVIHGNHH